jgi:hypothetical protein
MLKGALKWEKIVSHPIFYGNERRERVKTMIPGCLRTEKMRKVAERNERELGNTSPSIFNRNTASEEDSYLVQPTSFPKGSNCNEKIDHFDGKWRLGLDPTETRFRARSRNIWPHTWYQSNGVLRLGVDP